MPVAVLRARAHLRLAPSITTEGGIVECAAVPIYGAHLQFLTVIEAAPDGIAGVDLPSGDQSAQQAAGVLASAIGDSSCRHPA